MSAGRIVIAGAGIGGLTAALALAAHGIQSVVLEQANRLDAIGAGVQLSPNASRALIALGLKDKLAALAFSPAAIALHSVRAGRLIAQLPLRQTADAPYWVIHRADLQNALFTAALAHPSIELQFGAQVADIAHRADGMDVTVRHGDKPETLQGQALIGADGVWSQVRRAINPDAAPRVSGRIAWRGIAKVSDPLFDVHLWMGGNAHFVAYPVSRDGVVNLVVTVPRPIHPGDGDRSGADIAADLAKTGWPEQPCQLIGAAECLTPYPLLTLPPPYVMTRGPVALVGDAAHAMLPFAAQGAAMAIEDAIVLADCVATDGADITRAFARYGDLRRVRVARVVRTAAQSGSIYHLTGVMALARDAAIRLAGDRRLLARQNWIYDWTP